MYGTRIFLLFDDLRAWEELRQIEEMESRKRKSDGAEGGRVKKERRELVQLGGIIDLT